MVGRDWLRIEHVEGAVQPSGENFSGQCWRIDGGSTTDVDHQSAVGQGRQDLFVSQMEGLVIERGDHDEDIVGPCEPGELVRPMHRTHFILSTGSGHPGELDVEREEPSGNFLADSARSYQEYFAVAQGRAAPWIPSGSGLVPYSCLSRAVWPE